MVAPLPASAMIVGKKLGLAGGEEEEKEEERKKKKREK